MTKQVKFQQEKDRVLITLMDDTYEFTQDELEKNIEVLEQLAFYIDTLAQDMYCRGAK